MQVAFCGSRNIQSLPPQPTRSASPFVSVGRVPCSACPRTNGVVYRLAQQLGQLGADAIVEVLSQLATGTVQGKDQVSGLGGVAARSARTHHFTFVPGRIVGDCGAQVGTTGMGRLHTVVLSCGSRVVCVLGLRMPGGA